MRALVLTSGGVVVVVSVILDVACICVRIAGRGGDARWVLEHGVFPRGLSLEEQVAEGNAWRQVHEGISELSKGIPLQ